MLFSCVGSIIFTLEKKKKEKEKEKEKGMPSLYSITMCM
jgi:hypothetical protein